MAGLPHGLVHVPELLGGREEAELLDFMETVDFGPVVMHGQAAKRVVRHYGLRYDYASYRLAETDPFPAPIAALRDRCAALPGVEPERLVQALVTRYPPGAGIGWHRDAPRFGAPVVGISLGAPCRMRFQRGKGERREVAEQVLEPRSGYALFGAARWSWQHSIPATRAERHSVTFRVLRD